MNTQLYDFSGGDICSNSKKAPWDLRILSGKKIKFQMYQTEGKLKSAATTNLKAAFLKYETNPHILHARENLEL